MARGKDSENDSPKTPSSIPVPKSKRGLKGFFTDVRRELKKVNWPSRAETMRLTSVVLGVCVLMAAILTTMSWASDTLVGLIVHAGGKS